MLKRPICPYCKAIYDRKEINSQKNNQIIKCHNCKKNFRVQKNKGFLILMCCTFIFAILFNIFLLSVIKVRNILSLIFCTVLIIIIGFTIRHLSVRYKKEEKDT